jgi:PAS domain S-box-containing protein
MLPAEGAASNWVIQNREWYVVSSREELRQTFPVTFQVMEEAGMQSFCALPLVAGERVRGTLFFMASAPDAYSSFRRPFMDQIASAVAVALDDCLVHEEVRRLNDELAARRIAELEEQKRHISDQLKMTGAALTESEERLRDLFDEAPIAYVNEGLDSKFIRANRTALRILGVKPEDVPHTYGKDLVPDTPEAQEKVRLAFDSIEKGIDTSGVVLELRRKDDGKPIWIQWWSRPDPSGAYAHHVRGYHRTRAHGKREGPAGGSEQVSAGGNPQRTQLRRNRRQHALAAQPPSAGRKDCRHRFHGTDPRRNRDRKGTHCPGDSRSESPARARARKGQLWRDFGGTG